MPVMQHCQACAEA